MFRTQKYHLEKNFKYEISSYLRYPILSILPLSETERINMSE